MIPFPNTSLPVSELKSEILKRFTKKGLSLSAEDCILKSNGYEMEDDDVVGDVVEVDA
jgi:hypothetical protein